MKQVDELFVGMPVEDQRAAICVKRHFQHAALGTREAGIGETVAIVVEFGHCGLHSLDEISVRSLGRTTLILVKAVPH